MTKLTKKQKTQTGKIDSNKLYPLVEAIGIVKTYATAKFDESIDVAVQLGIDAKKSDQVVRGAVVMPNGTGKTKRVAVFAQGDRAQAARDAGADVVGFDDLAADIKGDLSGLLTTGESGERITSRMSAIGQEWSPTAYPVELYGLGGEGTGVAPTGTDTTDVAVRVVVRWSRPEPPSVTRSTSQRPAPSMVSGTVTVTSERPLSRAQLFEVFLSTLRANGLVVTPTQSGAYRISPAQGAARSIVTSASSVTYSSSSSSPRAVTQTSRLPVGGAACSGMRSTSSSSPRRSRSSSPSWPVRSYS